MVFAIICFLFLPRISSHAAEVYLGIEHGGEKIRLGMAQFESRNRTPEEIIRGAVIRNTVINDLLFSLYFKIHESYEPFFTDSGIDFQSWDAYEQDALIGAIINIRSSLIRLEVRAYNPGTRQLLWRKIFSGTDAEIRNIAHAVSDEIVRRFTGERGIALTKITYINDASGNKEVYTADYDGFNQRRITHLRSIALFPRWSPRGDNIIFTSYHHGNPDLFMVSKDGVIIKPVSMRQGLNTSGRWSPDGSQIAVTLSMGRSPNIYLIKTNGTIVRQLTYGWGAEVSACFSPDGRYIVYTSDKPGYPQLYTLQLEGMIEQRLLYGNYADSPVWSPRGDKVAFSMMSISGKYDIYTIDPSGRNITQLTSFTGNNENPSWSPDGRFILFVSDRNGKNEIFVMAYDGTAQKKMFDTEGNCYTPDWSQ